MENDEIKYLYCANDGTKAETLATADGPETVRCPACGQSDTFEQAVADAAKGQIQDMLGGVFGGSKTFTSKKVGPDARWRLGQ